MKELDLLLTFQPITFFKFQLYSSMGMRNKWTSNLLGEAAEENDEDQVSHADTIGRAGQSAELCTEPSRCGSLCCIALHSADL